MPRPSSASTIASAAAVYQVASLRRAVCDLHEVVEAALGMQTGPMR